jgi:hypothetical protein
VYGKVVMIGSKTNDMLSIGMVVYWLHPMIQDMVRGYSSRYGPCVAYARAKLSTSLHHRSHQRVKMCT